MDTSTALKLLSVGSPALMIAAFAVAWPDKLAGGRPRGRRAVVVWTLVGLAVACLVTRIVLKQD